MKTITIATEKGGTGKTTTAQALIEAFRDRGYRVLGIDLDSQANLTYSMNAKGNKYSVKELLTKEATIGQVVENDFIKASNLINDTNTLNASSLKEALKPIASDYDFCIIDTPPQLNKILIKGLVACDYVIIPTPAQAYAIMGLDNILDVIATIKAEANIDIKILGVLLTMYNKRSNLGSQLKTLIESKAKVFNTTINRNIAIEEAQALQEPILKYKKGVRAITNYEMLAEEILESL